MASSHTYSQYLPGILADIADVAGLDAALKVAEAKGGRRALFPCEPKADHWLVDLVGAGKALDICKRVGPGRGSEWLDVPFGPGGRRAKFWRIMHELIDQGLTKPEIVERLGVSARTVQRHKNGTSGRPKTDPDQPELF